LAAKWDFADQSDRITYDTSGNNIHMTNYVNYFVGMTWNKLGTNTTGKYYNMFRHVRAYACLVSPVTNIWTRSGKFTTSQWIKPIEKPAVFRSMLSGWGYPNYVFAVGMSWQTVGKPTLYIWDGSAPYACTANSEVATNVWTHVVTSYDGAKARIYLNGILDKEVTHNKTVTLNPTQLQVGSDVADNYPYNAYFANIKVYTNSLASNDVYNLYLNNGGTNGPTGNMESQP
jgi:hypothetical protein